MHDQASVTATQYPKRPVEIDADAVVSHGKCSRVWKEERLEGSGVNFLIHSILISSSLFFCLEDMGL